MIPLPPIAARILLGVGALALLWAAWAWSDHRGYERGVAFTDAQWAAASARMQAAAVRSADASERLAQARQDQLKTDIEDLRHEAAKGTADPVGVGVSATLERMRQQQARR